MYGNISRDVSWRGSILGSVSVVFLFVTLAVSTLGALESNGSLQALIKCLLWAKYLVYGDKMENKTLFMKCFCSGGASAT